MCRSRLLRRFFANSIVLPTSEFVEIPDSGLNCEHEGKLVAGDHRCPEERQRPPGGLFAFTQFIEVILELADLWVQYKISAGEKNERSKIK